MLKFVKLNILLILTAIFSINHLHAASVTGIYEGIITNDSGLGLLGQTLRVQLTYEDSTTGTPRDSSTLYSGLITDANVTVGSNIWGYDGSGSSRLFLNDNDTIVISNGPEDRVNLSVSSFTGPDLGTGPIFFGPQLQLRLSDLEPNGTPDAVVDDTVLPSTPFDIALFDDDNSVLSNTLSFSWSTEDDDFFIFSADAFELVPIPVPAAVWLFGSAILGVVCFSKKKSGSTCIIN